MTALLIILIGSASALLLAWALLVVCYSVAHASAPIDKSKDIETDDE